MENKNFDLAKFNGNIKYYLDKYKNLLTEEKEKFNKANYDFIRIAYNISIYSFILKNVELIHKHVNQQYSFIGTERFTRKNETFFFEDDKNNFIPLEKKLVTEELAKESSLHYINYIKTITTKNLITASLMNSTSPSSNLENLAIRVGEQTLLDIIENLS